MSLPPTPAGVGEPSYTPSSSYPPPPSDPFDFILEECGSISPSHEAILRNCPFVRQERQTPAPLPADAEVLTAQILYRIFGLGSPHPGNHRRRYSDAEAAELALTDYFLRLGPRRQHLLLQPLDGKQAGGTQFPSGTPETAKEVPGEMPRPSGSHPNFLLEAAAATPPVGKGKGAGLKRGRPDDSSYSSRSPFSTTDGRYSESKKSCVDPGAADPTAGTCSPDVGMIPTGDMPPPRGRPPSADHGGRGSRNLPPFILCPVNREEGAVGDERATRLRPRRPPRQVEQKATGKAPAAGAAAHADPTAGTCFSDAGVIPTVDMPPPRGRPSSAVHGGRGSRNLPPSILCPVNWEQGEVGDERGTRLRPRRPLRQVEHKATGKNPAAGAAAHADPTVGTCSPDAGAIPTGDMPAPRGRPPSADHGGQGSRNLQPSILRPVNTEEGAVGDERGTHRRYRRPPRQVKQKATGKAPAAGAGAHALSVCSAMDGSSPAESAGTPSSAHAAGVDMGDATGPPPSLATLVEGASSSRVRSEDMPPSMEDSSDSISVSTYLATLLRFCKSSIQTPEEVELLEALATKGAPLPAPKW